MASTRAEVQKPSPGEALLNSFEWMKIVNLPHRVDRRNEFTKQLRNIGIDHSRDGVAFFEAIRPQTEGDFPSIGAYGCFLSHLAILKDARERDLETILICEDDLNFSADFGQRIEQTLSMLVMEDWSIFYGFQPDNLPTSVSGLSKVPPSLGIQCAHFVVFRRPAIRALIPYLEAMLMRPSGHADGGPMHVDGAYNWFRLAHPHMKTFAATPSLGYQRSSSTDIAEKSFADRSFILKPFVRYARALKNRIRG